MNIYSFKLISSTAQVFKFYFHLKAPQKYEYGSVEHITSESV